MTKPLGDNTGKSSAENLPTFDAAPLWWGEGNPEWYPFGQGKRWYSNLNKDGRHWDRVKKHSTAMKEEWKKRHKSDPGQYLYDDSDPDPGQHVQFLEEDFEWSQAHVTDDVIYSLPFEPEFPEFHCRPISYYLKSEPKPDMNDRRPFDTDAEVKQFRFKLQQLFNQINYEQKNLGALYTFFGKRDRPYWKFRYPWRMYNRHATWLIAYWIAIADFKKYRPGKIPGLGRLLGGKKAVFARHKRISNYDWEITGIKGIYNDTRNIMYLNNRGMEENIKHPEGYLLPEGNYLYVFYKYILPTAIILGHSDREYKGKKHYLNGFPIEYPLTSITYELIEGFLDGDTLAKLEDIQFISHDDDPSSGEGDLDESEISDPLDDGEDKDPNDEELKPPHKRKKVADLEWEKIQNPFVEIDQAQIQRDAFINLIPGRAEIEDDSGIPFLEKFRSFSRSEQDYLYELFLSFGLSGRDRQRKRKLGMAFRKAYDPPENFIPDPNYDPEWERDPRYSDDFWDHQDKRRKEAQSSEITTMPMETYLRGLELVETAKKIGGLIPREEQRQTEDFWLEWHKRNHTNGAKSNKCKYC